MIKIYIYDIKNISINNYEATYISEIRKNAIASYRKTDDKLRSIAVSILLEKALGKKVEDTFIYNSYGKPFLPNGKYFNISHSGDYTVLVTSDSLIGVDIEKHEFIDFLQIAPSCFTLNEIDYLVNSHNKTFAFYELWTLKESYIKYLGTGFSLEPKSFSMSILGSTSAIIKNTPDNPTPVFPVNYVKKDTLSFPPIFKRLHLFPNYSLSLCFPQNETSEIETIMFLK